MSVAGGQGALSFVETLMIQHFRRSLSLSVPSFQPISIFPLERMSPVHTEILTDNRQLTLTTS